MENGIVNSQDIFAFEGIVAFDVFGKISAGAHVHQIFKGYAI